jgi:WD40 repeat protein/tRNA A-37 threonylcarbamoyl transferase component Bud32
MSQASAPTWPRQPEALVQALEELWQQGEQPDPCAFLAARGICAPAQVAAVLACDQWQRWHAGQRVPAEDYLRRCPDLAADADAALELIYGEFLVRQALGEKPPQAEYLDRFPAFAPGLREQFALYQALEMPGATVGEGLPALVDRTDFNAPVAPGGPAPLPVRLAGHEILGELGRGGMGIVYKAVQSRLKRTVALKMILHGGFADPQMRLRFQHEAEAVARLQHPNIVQIYDVGEHEGLPFFSLEYVDGGSLAGQLDGTPWPPAAAARLVETLAQAIAAAHAAGLVHRDLKPANILMQRTEGRGQRTEPLTESASVFCPKITDFGLAKRLDGDGTDSATKTGAVVGTPSYMAPEQARGQGGTVGPATDIYSLGTILYELLTGRVPFRAESALETLEQVRTLLPVPPSRLQPKVPRDLDTICLHCMHKEPHKRYPTAAALAEDLRRFQRGEPIIARPATALEKTLKWVRRKPAHAAVLVISVAAALALLGSGLWFTAQLHTERDNAQAQADEAGKARDAEHQRARELADALKQAQAAQDAEKKRTLELQQQRDRTREVLKEAQHNLANSCVLLAESAWNGQGTAEQARHFLAKVPEDARDWEWRFLQRKYQGSLFILFGHTKVVLKVAFNGDGSRLASGSLDNTVRVWNVRTGQPLLELQHAGPVTGVAWNGDGNRLATASGTLRVWDARTGELQRELKGHLAPVGSVAWSSDGSRLAGGSADGKVRVWDANSGNTLLELKGHTAAVLHLAWSKDGSRLASTSLDKTVRVWDAQTGQSLLELKRPTRGSWTVAWNNDGSQLAAASSFDELFVWDVKAARIRFAMSARASGVMGMAWSGDDSRLAVACGDKTVRMLDAGTGQTLVVFKGHNAIVRGVAWCADCSLLASASDDKTVRLWDARTGQSALQLKGHTKAVTSVAWNKGSTRLASGSEDTTVRIWDARIGQFLFQLKGHTQGVTSVAWSGDGTRLASAAADETVRVWDVRTGQALLELRGHSEVVTSVAWSPAGDRLASASYDNTVRIWDARTGQTLAELRGHTDRVWSVAWSKAGDLLASAGADKTVRIWDGRTGQFLRELKDHTSRVRAIAWSDDDSRIASAATESSPAEGGSVWIWDARTGQPLLKLEGHSKMVMSAAWNSHGSRLASAAADRTVRVWDTRTGQSVLELKGHSDLVSSVAWSDDGSRIASGSHDKTVRVWDSRTGPVLLDLHGHTGMVTSVALSGDGSLIASASQDATVRLWGAKTGQLLHVLTGHPRSVMSVAFSKDGSQVFSTAGPVERFAWDVKTGERLHDVSVPSLAFARRTTSDGKILVVASGKDVMLVSMQADEDELGRRWWQTRPDPQWHLQKRQEFFKAKHAYGAALHLAFWQHARGVLAFEIGDFTRARAYFIAAAALMPTPPPPPPIKSALEPQRQRATDEHG